MKAREIHNIIRNVSDYVVTISGQVKLIEMEGVSSGSINDHMTITIDWSAREV